MLAAPRSLLHLLVHYGVLCHGRALFYTTEPEAYDTSQMDMIVSKRHLTRPEHVRAWKESGSSFLLSMTMLQPI